MRLFSNFLSLACIVISVCVILSVSIHPAMAAKAVDEQFEGCPSCLTGGLSALPGMEGKRIPAIAIREILPETSGHADETGLAGFAKAPSGLETTHPLPGFSLSITDPLTNLRAAGSIAGSEATGAVMNQPVPAEGLLAQVFANLSREGYTAAGSGLHRYESTVSSDDFSTINASQRAALAAGGFVFTSDDTVQSFRDITFYTFTNLTTQESVHVIAVQRLNAAKEPVGDLEIAVSPVFSGPGADAWGTSSTIYRGSSTTCAWKWIAVGLLAVGLVINIGLIALAFYAPGFEAWFGLAGILIGCCVYGDAHSVWAEWEIWGQKQLLTAFTTLAIVTGLLLLILLLYAVYDLGVCMGWWNALGEDTVVWDYQDRFLGTDNGRTAVLSLHDRFALALFSDTRVDAKAHWILESGPGLTALDTISLATENGTIQSWYIEAAEPGTHDLVLRYVTSHAVPPTVPGTTFVLHCTVGPGNWAIISLDATENPAGTGSAGSLAVDQAGVPHICYFDAINGRIMYATHQGTVWQREQVAESSGTISTSLTFDRSGNPAISYGDGLHFGNLMYAKKNGTQWDIAAVDKGSLGDAGQYSSLAIDPAGTPHIAYTDGHTFASLMYATQNSSDKNAWNLSQIDSGGVFGDVGYGVSLAFDAAGHPHAAYTAGKHFTNLMYATLNGDKWEITKVDNGDGLTQSTGLRPSLALDHRGYPHISYYYASGKDLRYASWNGTGWELETIDAINNEGEYSALALDAQDRPHIGYYDASFGRLRYATRTSPYTSWRIRTVDRDGDCGQFVNIALDPSGHPCFSYYDAKNHVLKYAEWRT